MPWGRKVTKPRGLKGRKRFWVGAGSLRPGSRGPSGRRVVEPVDPGHRPAASALGWFSRPVGPLRPQDGKARRYASRFTDRGGPGGKRENPSVPPGGRLVPPGEPSVPAGGPTFD